MFLTNINKYKGHEYGLIIELSGKKSIPLSNKYMLFQNHYPNLRFINFNLEILKIYSVRS